MKEIKHEEHLNNLARKGTPAKLAPALTKNEVKAICGIINSDFHDGQHPVDNPVWSWSCNTFGNTKTFSGVCSSLSKKGCVVTDNGRVANRDRVIKLTAVGLAAYEVAIGHAWNE